jgi:hypothetical protein
VSAETFHADLEALGFRFLQEDRRGELQYEKRGNRYLTYHVHWEPGSDVLFTWEFAIGEFFDHRRMQIGSNEALNLFLFPQYDARGPAEVSFIAGELDRVEQIFRGLDFIHAEA